MQFYLGECKFSRSAFDKNGFNFLLHVFTIAAQVN